MGACSIEGCNRALFCRGWCNSHYLRWLKTGNPTSSPIAPAGSGRTPRPMAERFWPKVQKGAPDACWPWLANSNHDGYGVFRVGGRNGTMKPASKVAFELTNGPVPGGLVVCHQCDNPPCCNPAHLFVGTQKDNVADMLQKGRGRHRHGIQRGIANA